MEELKEQIVDSLIGELSGEEFNVDMLRSKVSNAILEVRSVRNYPSSYSQETVDADLRRYYTNIRNIALYDYNKIGGEGEESHSENGISRSYSAREKLFYGVIPIASVT